MLEDASLRGSAVDWAQAAVEAYHRHGADRIVAEVNQGGDLVAEMLRQGAPLVPIPRAPATPGRGARGGPAAALYEQGRIRHLPGLQRLEEQMLLMASDGYKGKGSPDRVDALVWAVTAALLDPARKRPAPPRVRGLY